MIDLGMQGAEEIGKEEMCMNRLNELTIKSLRMNKKRTVMTIFGILLSTALICALGGLVASMQKTVVEDAKADNGDYHARFLGVLKENLGYVEENRNVEDFCLVEGLGYADFSESKNEDKPYFYLMAFDENSLERMGLVLVEGRMPENGEEVVISESILKNGGGTYQVGDVMELSVSERELNGEKLGQNNPFHGKEDVEAAEEDMEESGQEKKEEAAEGTQESKTGEVLKEKFKKSYTVVGIVERPNYTIEQYTAPGYSVITKMDEVQERADIYVNFDHVVKTRKYAAKIQETLKKYQDMDSEPQYNSEVLRWSGSDMSDDTRSFLYGVGSIVILIIMVSSVFVIRNSFAISVMERMKQYGMLASIGATSVQIRKNVLFEAFLLGLAGIPAGMLAGMAAAFLLVQVMERLLKGSITVIRFYYSMPPEIIVLSVVLSSVTIYFSASSSARKAAKISPLEAIRSNQDIKLSAKKVKAPKLIKKCFGVGGEIAYKNLKRSRKRYRTTVISLVVSIALFLSMYAFVQYGFVYSNSYYSKLDYNMIVHISSDENTEEVYQIYQQISTLDGIDSFSIVRQNSNYVIQGNLSDLGKVLAENNHLYQEEEEETEDLEKETEQKGEETKKNEEKPVRCWLVSLGEDAYNEYAASLGIKKQEKNGVILVENGYHYLSTKDRTKTVFWNFYDLQEKDTVTVTSDDGDLSLKLMKVTTEKPMGLQDNYMDEGFFVISDELMDKIGASSFRGMRIQAKDPYALETEIKEAVNHKAYCSVSNLKKDADEENSMVLAIEILLYGFITVITLIGVTNIFNTVTTNMNLREKEFAMLRSVGMTQKEFSGMIQLESIFYGAKALLIGLPLGTAGAYLLFRVVNDNMGMKFTLPWRAYLVAVVFVMLIVGVTMKYSFGKMKDRNIIEAIRKDTV
jgi:putative ABC transport system permease protein